MKNITTKEELRAAVTDFQKGKDKNVSYYEPINVIGDELISHVAELCGCSKFIDEKLKTNIDTNNVCEVPYIIVNLDMNNGEFHYRKERAFAVHSCFAVSNGDSTIYLFPHCRSGKNTMYLCDNIVYSYLPPDWLISHPMPSRIGTFTEKKICEWANWLVKRGLAAANNQDDCYRCFDEFVADLESRGYKPRVITPHELGEVCANGIHMRFFTCGHPRVNTDITLRVRTQGIETSYALANNNYKE